MDKIYTIGILFLLFLAVPASPFAETPERNSVVYFADNIELSIETQGSKVLLSWSVRNNLKVHEVTVYRAIETEKLAPIHKMSARNISADFVDHLLGSEVDAKKIAYQVEVTLTNGERVFSETKIVDLNERRALKPTIFTSGSTIQFDFHSLKRGNVQAQVFNMTSRLVKQQQFTAYEGENQSTIYAGNLKRGMYFLRLEQDGKSTTTKFFVR